MTTYILLVIGAIFLTLFLSVRTKDGGMSSAVLKTVTSFFFVATAVAAVIGNYTLTGSMNANKLLFMGLILLGLVCGLVGDLTLDLKILYRDSNMRHSDDYTFFGMAAFGVGHILYIVAVALYFGFSAWTILIAAGVTAAIFCTSIFLMKMSFGKFLIPSILYAFLLTLFLASAIAAGIRSGFSLTIVLLSVGAGLFLLSDLVLSMTYFDGNDSRVMIIINHVLYYAAQFLIALSLFYTSLVA
ncbi:MAG: hypothetical protein IJU10_00830 [Clostridia bacterium]|nr:hypothetical protein [Clostridia bacterium]